MTLCIIPKEMRQVLCRNDEAVALSRDQTALRADERARVLAAGGDVRWRMDGWRVGSAGLQVTRCVHRFECPSRVRTEGSKIGPGLGCGSCGAWLIDIVHCMDIQC